MHGGPDPEPMSSDRVPSRGALEAGAHNLLDNCVGVAHGASAS